MRARFAIALCLALALPGGAGAHEFWMLPQRFDPPAGSTVSLRLEVGQEFTGERVGVSQALVTRLSRIDAGGRTEWRGRLPAQPSAVAGVPLGAPGGAVIALDTSPFAIELPAATFEAYLRMEGLDDVIRKRAAAGATDSPGRERYRRNVKALLHVGGVADDTVATRRTGQRLEIVPIAGPLKPGQPLQFRVEFDGRPLAGTLVKFWHQPGRPAASEVRSDAGGVVQVTLDAPGAWMASTVHMVPAEATPEFDWDSFWGNLTFEAGPAP